MLKAGPFKKLEFPGTLQAFIHSNHS